MVLDERVAQFVLDHRNGCATKVFRVVTELGSFHTVAPLALVVALVLLHRRDIFHAVALVVSVSAAEAASDLLKLACGRARPPAGQALVHVTGYALPSGHTTQATAFFGALALIVARRGAPRGLAWAARGSAALVAASVGVSRVYLGVHWATDVVAGWVLGASILAGVGSFDPSRSRGRRPVLRGAGGEGRTHAGQPPGRSGYR